MARSVVSVIKTEYAHTSVLIMLINSYLNNNSAVWFVDSLVTVTKTLNTALAVYYVPIFFFFLTWM